MERERERNVNEKENKQKKEKERERERKRKKEKERERKRKKEKGCQLHYKTQLHKTGTTTHYLLPTYHGILTLRVRNVL